MDSTKKSRRQALACPPAQPCGKSNRPSSGLEPRFEALTAVTAPWLQSSEPCLRRRLIGPRFENAFEVTVCSSCPSKRRQISRIDGDSRDN